MLARALIALVVVAIASTQLRAEHDPVAKVGDQLVLKMTGKLAVEYARRTGSGPEVVALDGLYIETTAIVAQKLDDGRIRIEHSSRLNHSDDETRLVTLTAAVDQRNIELDVTAKGTPIHASPTADPEHADDEVQTLRLNLADLKGLKLRTWKLTDEIGG